VALLVQFRRYVKAVTATERDRLYGLYTIEEVGERLWIKHVISDGVARLSPEPFAGAPELPCRGYGPGGTPMTVAEAELLTGLAAPVCWDKIRDLM
jgi:hypothetical protein